MLRKILPLLLLVLTFALFLTACGGDGHGNDNTSGDTSDTTSANTPGVGTTTPVGDIALTGDVTYTIIRSADASDEEIGLCSDLWKKILSLTGKSVIGINDDFVKNPEDADNDNPEILIGLTNRPQSSLALSGLPSYLDWEVSVNRSKIVIAANTIERLAEAIEYFVDSLEMRDGVLYYTGKTVIGSYDGYKFLNLSVCGRNISEYVITITKDASNADKEFAERLSMWFALNTGFRPEITAHDAPVDSGRIAIRGDKFVDTALTGGDYILNTADGLVEFCATSLMGYNKAMEKMQEKISNGALASGITETYHDEGTSLDGKKVAFVGNSFLYYGACVELGNQRSADKGVFWQICNANGENVTVYDFTYGGHRLYDFTEAGDKTGGSGSPGKGKDLLAGVDLADIDIVFISEAGENNSNFVTDVKNVMKRFTKPGVQFVYVTHSYTYLKNHTNIINALPTLRKQGVLIADWGRLVYDLIRRTVKVENSAFTYTQTTFIKNKGDTHHPNPLAGYITAGMCYSVVTGKSAVGQAYDFCRDRQFGGSTSGFDGYINKHYNSAKDTNFVSIFESPTEMAGIQKLMDDYVEKNK